MVQKYTKPTNPYTASKCIDTIYNYDWCGCPKGCSTGLHWLEARNGIPLCRSTSELSEYSLLTLPPAAGLRCHASWSCLECSAPHSSERSSLSFVSQLASLHRHLGEFFGKWYPYPQRTVRKYSCNNESNDELPSCSYA